MHLTAACDEDASRAATLLTDAFRTASLPGADEGKVVVVRRLALGRIRIDVSPASLALHIERVMRRAALDAVPFDHPTSPASEAVLFPDRAAPLVALARLHARHAPTEAWFWPAVVPEWRAARDRGDRWRLLLDAAHALPEAAVVAAAIVNEAVEAGAERELLTAIPTGRALAWLRRAGWSECDPAPPPAGRDAGDVLPPVAARAALEFGPLDERVVWFGTMLAVHAAPARAADAALPAKIAGALSRTAHASSPSAAMRRVADAGAPAGPFRGLGPIAAQDPNVTGDGVAVTGQGSDGAAGARRAPDAIADPALPTEPAADAPHDRRPSPEARGCFTPYAGLFLVVPILARLGIGAFLASRPGDLASAFPQRLLWFIGTRVGLTADDPLATALRDGLLLDAPPDFSDRVSRDRRVMWLSAVRRWSKRHLRMGLRELVSRPGRVYVSRTHVEVTFDLLQLDLRVRRVALDVDPGWVPWLGRVLVFRYVDSGSGHE